MRSSHDPLISGSNQANEEVKNRWSERKRRKVDEAKKGKTLEPNNKIKLKLLASRLKQRVEIVAIEAMHRDCSFP